MRRTPISVLIAAAAVAALLFGAPGPAAGQAPAAGPQGYLPPRTLFGQPDLQGVWRVWNLAKHDIQDHSASWGVPAGKGVVEGNEIPYQPWAAAQKAENYKNSRTTDPLESADSHAKCYLPGVPRITYLGFPFQIFQTRDRVVILYEWRHVRRIIYLNNEPSVFEGVDLWMGTSRGRFEGNTLVVNVRNLSDRPWFDAAGNFHSSALELEERYTPVDPDTLRYEVTIEDSKVFTRPWKMSMLIQRQKEIGLLEYECHALLKETGVPLTWPRI